MTIAEMLEAARSRITRATTAETAAAIESGGIVIDLRCAETRRQTGMIPGSIPIARSVLEWRCDPTSESRDERVARPRARVILVCEEGYSSSLAADSLRTLGFEDVGDLIGGFEAWAAEGRPTSAP